MPLAMTQYDVEKIFTYHPPVNDQAVRYNELREAAKDLALRIWHSCPDSREKSMAITHLQHAIMCANASIAINEAVDKN